MRIIKFATIKIGPANKAVYILQGVTNKDLHDAAGSWRDATNVTLVPQAALTRLTTWHHGKSLCGPTKMMNANMSPNYSV